MRGSEEKRAGTQATKFFVCTYDIFSIKRVNQKFHVATTTAKIFFLPITPTGFCLFGWVFFGLSHCPRRLALHDCSYVCFE